MHYNNSKTLKILLNPITIAYKIKKIAILAAISCKTIVATIDKLAARSKE